MKNKITVDQTEGFLTYNTYYLDFAYLVEISILDTYLRDFIHDLSLSIEHSYQLLFRLKRCTRTLAWI